METRRLNESEFKATFAVSMQNVTESATDVLDIWPYVESIPSADFEGHSTCDEVVEYIYRTVDDRFDHALVKTYTDNVYLVVVVDLVNDSIHGHRLLDLNKLYGLS